jgi:cyclic-di-AMP phosphodiesterase PgpH
MFAWSRRHEPRLENWDGRKRSTRDGGAMLPRIWSKPVIARLVLAFATAGCLVALLYLNSPPFPYRFGAVMAHDFRARIAFAVPNEAFAAHNVEPGDPDEIPAFSDSPPTDRYSAGAVLIRRGQKIDGPKLVLLMAEHRAYAANLSFADHAVRLLALVLIVLILAILLAVYVAQFQKPVEESLRRVGIVCSLIVLCVGLALILSRPPWDAAIIPLTLTAMVLAIVGNPPFALILSFCIAIVLGIGHGTGLSMLLVHSGGMATAILMLREIRSRTRPVEVSALAGITYLLLSVATGMLHDQPTRLFVIDGMRYFLWSLLAGFILAGSLPFVERCFGVITDATLLELADSSHPLMQELVRRAPGTYTHSMTVATLAEGAAEAIAGNTLLVRVGSYFHDIGKMLKPQYFIENQNGENRHDQLEPALSTLVIMGHVKDGIALAKQYGLPRQIVDFIAQHHGTTLVEYFYHEAKRIQDESGDACDLESAFRYQGPKPRTREAGILMLADAAEGASRTLDEPTPNSLRKLTHDLMMKRLLDGQFDESGLTLSELHLIEDSQAKSLTAVFHARIRYQQFANAAS